MSVTLILTVTDGDSYVIKSDCEFECDSYNG